MKRTYWGLAVVSVLVAAGSFAAAQGPAAGDNKTKGADEARILVKQLEAQVDSQRATLKRSEANLEQAKALLSALTGGTPHKKLAAELRAIEQNLEQQMGHHLAEIDRGVRPRDDLSVVLLKEGLSSIRRKIKMVESR